MGEVIELHTPEIGSAARGLDRCPVCCVVRSFRSRVDAERAADLLGGHVRFPGLVGIVKRRGRLGTRIRFELAVEETDLERAVAVLSIAGDGHDPLS